MPPPPDMKVETLTFGPGVVWEPRAGDGPDEALDLGLTDIQRLVASIGRASKVAQLPVPRKPWLPDLGAVYDLADLPTSSAATTGCRPC